VEQCRAQVMHDQSPSLTVEACELSSSMLIESMSHTIHHLPDKESCKTLTENM